MSLPSPLLFMIYLSRIEKKLEECNLGFELSLIKRGRKGMFYAHDIVLLADSQDRLQELIKICGEEGDSLGLKSSSDKSGIMVYNDEKGDPQKIQDVLIEYIEKYKYLEVWLNEGKRYFRRTGRKYSKERKKRDAAIMKHRALWNYDRYEVRRIWKGVRVPGLSFGNAVLYTESEVQLRL